MLLPETSQAVNNLLSDSRFGAGFHTYAQPRTGVPGLRIGSVDFDPQAGHLPHQILPFSLMEDVTGNPQVAQTLPDKPVTVSMIADFRPNGDVSRVEHYKRGLIGKLASELGLVGNITDRMYTYHIGSPTFDGGIDSEQLRGREDFTAAQSVADICNQGLTLVVGSLRNLPLIDTGANFKDLIAVKVNHPAERKMLENVGVISLGNGLEVDTNDSEQVDYVNGELQKQHQAIVSPLQRAGAKVVEVVWSPKHAEGFDAASADIGISTAVNAYAKSKH